ncbi:hypothetical protein [Kribbella italica]|uniref:Uncharacterized protein n=1 Tax=Kribbella italica TaxID=1540520 RepID=A0A7W9MRQ5_9ACTN|nr:hypothetical protein [Kribbella italica]MBB5833372.1 hypothetical protein [Kribbella italica]
MPRKRLPSQSSKPKAQPVTTVRLGLNHLTPLARTEAERRSGGDASRVEVVDPNTFIVR